MWKNFVDVHTSEIDQDHGDDDYDSSDFEDEADRRLMTFDIHLEENIFGALVYVWARRKNTGFTQRVQHIVVTCLFLFTVYVQFVLSWYMIPFISINENVEKLTPENQFATWRSAVGGANASQVCNGHEWSWFEDVVDEMKKYTTPARLFFVVEMNKGEMFGVLTIGLWVCLLIIQLRRSIASMMLVCLDDDEIEVIANKADIGKQKQTLLSMVWNIGSNPCAKIVVVGLFFVRVALTMVIGYFGTRFLANTPTLKDFILNSVALAFVFEVPDTVYGAFALVSTQQQIKRLNLAWEENHVKVCLDARAGWFTFFSLLVFFGSGIAASRVGYKGLQDYSNILGNSVYGQLCAKVAGNTSELF